MISRTARLPLLLAASALLLTGCVTSSSVDRPDDAQATRPSVAEPAGPTTPPVTPAPTATPAPIPEPEPTRPALEDLVLTSEGLGTIRFGDHPADYDPETSMLVPDHDACGVEGRTDWYSVYEPKAFDTGDWGGAGVTVIDLMGDTIATDRGLDESMSLEQALELYPEAYLLSGGGGIEMYIAESEPADIYFVVSRSSDGTVSGLTGLGATTLEVEGAVTPHGFVQNGCA